MNIKKIKKITPTFTAVITTADLEDNSKGEIILLNKNKGDTSNIQQVVAVGSMVNTFKVGDIVHINPARFGKPKYKEGSLKDGVIENNFMVEYNIPTIEVNGKDYLFIQDRDIDYIINEYE